MSDAPASLTDKLWLSLIQQHEIEDARADSVQEQALTICMRLYDTARLSFEQQARTSCYSASCAASKGYIRAYLMPCTRPEPCVTMTAVRKPQRPLHKIA